LKALDEAPTAVEIADYLMQRERAVRAWGVTVDDIAPGRARLCMKVSEAMLNSHGVMHGGLIFALADTALAYAANSRNQTNLTQQASVVFLSSVQAGELLTADAIEGGGAGRSKVFNVKVTAQDGRDVAQVQGLTRSIGATVIRSE
jgi:acyl-CoA thioesterase